MFFFPLNMAEFSKCHGNCKESLANCLISASHWTNRRLNPMEVIMDYLNVSKKFSDEAHQLLPKNEWAKRQYSDQSEKCFFTAYGLNSMPNSPIFAFIHGGLWQIEAVTVEIQK